MLKECIYTEEEDDCDGQSRAIISSVLILTGSCVWDGDSCYVSNTWTANEIYRIVGDSDNPVCQYYTADFITGCIQHKFNTNAKTMHTVFGMTTKVGTKRFLCWV